MGRKSYVPVIVAPLYAVRLEQLGPDDVLHVRCEACRRVVLIEPADLGRGRPAWMRVKQVAERLRCLRCGAGPVVWSVYRQVAAPDP